MHGRIEYSVLRRSTVVLLLELQFANKEPFLFSGSAEIRGKFV